MKKEDIVIEISEKAVDMLSNLSFEYELDLNHLSFNEFVIRNDFKADNSMFEAAKKDIMEKHRDIAYNFSEKEISSIIKSIMKDMTSGLNTHVKIIDKRLEIRSDSADFDLTFKDYIVPTEWMNSDICNIELVNMSDNLTSIIKENVEYQKPILLVALQVIGLLIYLQLPNKIQSIEKTSRLEVVNKFNKKKSKNSKKIYLYKTTYKINDKDIDVDFAKYNSDTRSYTRKVEEWATRGHWRTLKDGRKIWIKECIKKSKVQVNNPINNPKENVSNNYKITKVDI